MEPVRDSNTGNNHLTNKARDFSVTVYAASSSRLTQEYTDAAFTVGKVMAERGWIQVNGGGRGLMMACTQGALSASGFVDCVILDQFFKTNMGEGFRHVEVCKNMVDRRAGLYKRGDAFVSLPGGLGTLEELAEVLSWRQLDFHDKPIVLVNTKGFYDAFWQFIQRGIEEGFIAEAMGKCVFLVDNPEDVVHVIINYRPVTVFKQSTTNATADWIDSAK